MILSSSYVLNVRTLTSVDLPITAVFSCEFDSELKFSYFFYNLLYNWINKFKLA